MKKIVLLFTALLGVLCGFAQSNQRHFIFENMPMGSNRDAFVFQMGYNFGWKTLSQESDVEHLIGEYCECDCDILILYTPITKRPVRMTLLIKSHPSLLDSNYKTLKDRYIKTYGSPFSVKTLAKDMDIWKKEGVGVIILSKTLEGAIEVEVNDELNRATLYKEQEVIVSK